VATVYFGAGNDTDDTDNDTDDTDNDTDDAVQSNL